MYKSSVRFGKQKSEVRFEFGKKIPGSVVSYIELCNHEGWCGRNWEKIISFELS